jgi:exo-1,4-beta-D-glucosaminidase
MKVHVISLILMIFLLGCTAGKETGMYEITLRQNWKMQSSKEIETASGQVFTNPENFKWINATVPGTVLNSMVEAGIYTDVYKDMNLESIPVEQFATSWFFLNEFDLENLEPVSILVFEGINYRANVWINGQKIFDKQELVNPFRQFQKNIGQHLKKGKNQLLIEVFPPVAGDFSIGFVDWNPTPPDKNMGITRDVKIQFNQGVSLKQTYVEAKLSDDYQKAALHLSTLLTNHTEKDMDGTLHIKGDGFQVSKKVSLKKGEQQVIRIEPSEFAVLNILNPKLWWPHNLGTPHLYRLEASFEHKGKVSDKEDVQYGIRKFESFFNEQGHRGIKVNGHKVSIRGGGWVDDLMLSDNFEFVRNQLEYVKDMNLNTVRLEGFWGKDREIYRLCDEMGILIMVGWSCHWEWEAYLGKACDYRYGGILSDEDIDMMSKAWKDQIVWLRNHASIFAWLGGSDCIPKPELENKYFDIFKQYDTTRVYMAAAKEWTSQAGPTGVKMRGPYDYVPPVYWYSDTLYGGAFGFNTETGPGAQVPPIESIKKMIGEKNLWPINPVWDYHCGRHAFGKLDKFVKALDLRYGKSNSVEEFATKAQLLNYELMRPMFEAFSINRYKATGLIQWMLNSAWPEMYWQLYDWYLMPNGAYYGAKKAGQPVQAIYNYHNKSVYLVNDKIEPSNDITLDIKVFDINSNLVHEKSITKKLEPNHSTMVYEIPELKNLTKTYFLSLTISDKGTELADNFYWLSTVEDQLDYKAKVEGWYFHTPSKAYADYTALNKMEKIKPSHDVTISEIGDFKVFEVNLTNKSDKIAFFIENRIIDKQTGETILPVLWSDNYVSVLPGKSKKLTAKIRKSYLVGKNPEFVMNTY